MGPPTIRELRSIVPPHGPDALDRLRELVGADPRSNTEVGRAAGMSQARISAILTGRRLNPSVATVARLLAALGKTWRDLDD